MDASTGIRLRDFRWASLLLLASWLLGAWLYVRLPASVPVHWNAAGQVDRYGSPVEGALLMPAIATLVLPLFAFLPRLDPRRANYGSFRGTWVALTTGIVGFLLVVQALVGAQGLGANFNLGRLLPPLIGLLFVGIGLLLPRMRPNWFAGIRTPWTLEDDRVWEATHRFGGKLFVVTGAVAAVLALLVPPPWQLLVMVVPIMVAVIGSVVYSYVVWRRIHRPPGSGG